jgi:hypothetical protein
MDYRWQRIDDDRSESDGVGNLQEMILDSFLKIYGEYPTIPPPNDARSFSNVVFYLAKMKVKWPFFPKSVQIAIYRGIVMECSNFDPFSITNLIFA